MWTFCKPTHPCEAMHRTRCSTKHRLYICGAAQYRYVDPPRGVLTSCVGLLALLAACSGAETSDSAGTVSTTSAAPGEAAGAEAPSVTFTHPSLGWSIAGPGHDDRRRDRRRLHRSQ